MSTTGDAAAGVTPAQRLRAAVAPGGPVRRWAPLVGLGLAAVIFSIIGAQQPPSGLPFDPRSTEPEGTKALVLTLERLGADVTLLGTPVAPDVDTLLIMVDNLDEETANQVEDFAERGGTVVVGDYSGMLANHLRPAGSGSVGFVQATLPRACDVPALQTVERIRPGGTPVFVVPEGATGCFGEGETAWMIIRDVGSGTLVTTGGPTFMTNALIGEHDNAVLAAALLAPEPGARVGILEPSFVPASGGTRSLGDLIPDGLLGVGLQLLIAFGIIVLWRARRLGRPVREPAPVRLPGSEIVVALGNLYQRTAAHDRAAELLRADLRRSLSEQLGVPPDVSIADIAEIAAQRSGARRDDIIRALSEPVSGGEGELVELAQLIESIRTDIRTSAATASGDARVSR